MNSWTRVTLPAPRCRCARPGWTPYPRRAPACPRCCPLPRSAPRASVQSISATAATAPRVRRAARSCRGVQNRRGALPAWSQNARSACWAASKAGVRVPARRRREWCCGRGLPRRPRRRRTPLRRAWARTPTPHSRPSSVRAAVGWARARCGSGQERCALARGRADFETGRQASDRRRAPAPTNRRVENPSRSAWATLAIPGPRSSASTSSRGRRSEHNRRAGGFRRAPACWTMLVAASVTTSATRPMSDSPNFSAAASCDRAVGALRPRRSPPRWGARWRRGGQEALRPSRHRDTRAFADAGDKLEFVDQSFRAAEAEPHAAPGGEAVGHRLCDVGDARSVVLEGEAHAATFVVRERSRAAASRRRRG